MRCLCSKQKVIRHFCNIARVEADRNCRQVLRAPHRYCVFHEWCSAALFYKEIVAWKCPLGQREVRVPTIENLVLSINGGHPKCVCHLKVVYMVSKTCLKDIWNCTQQRLKNKNVSWLSLFLKMTYSCAAKILQISLVTLSCCYVAVNVACFPHKCRSSYELRWSHEPHKALKQFHRGALYMSRIP